MFCTTTLTSRAAAVASIIVAAAAFAMVAPKQARADGETGYRAGATVYCDSFSNRLDVQARFGRWAGFSSQTIAYTHYIRNIDTGATILLTTPNNGQWFTLNHYQPFNGVPWALQGVDQYWYPPNGRYRLYTKYSWYSGYWATTGWIEAAHYNSIGGTSYYCTL